MDASTTNLGILSSPQAEHYFVNADRRVMIGLRACLEMLSLPVPDYAQRRKPGPTPAKATLAAFYADNPRPRSTMLLERKANAAPDRVAAVQALNASGMGSPAANLFNQVFPA